MCSQKWPDLLGRDAEAVMLEVVTAVAERSFFSVAERCDAQRFATLSEGTAAWMVGRVAFTEPDCDGAVSCTISQDLAHALFDAFTGRAPLDPAPDPDEVLDLVGEFSNMVCGTWLTRLATRQSFSLSRPVVRPAPDPTQLAAPAARLLLTINDLPLAVEVRVARLAGAPNV